MLERLRNSRRIRKYFERSLKAALWLAIVGVAVHIVGDVFASHDSKVEPAERATDAGFQFDPEHAWQFSGREWDITYLRFSNADFDQRWLIPLSSSTTGAKASAKEKRLLAMIAQWCQCTGRTETSETWSTETNALKIIAFVDRGQSDARLVGGRVAWPGEQNDWIVLEIRPQHSIGGNETAEENLLPLPSGSEIAARRRDSNGNLQCQIVRLPIALEQANAFWKKATVAVDQKEDNGRELYLCKWQGRRINVVRLPTHSPNSSIVMLMVMSEQGDES